MQGLFVRMSPQSYFKSPRETQFERFLEALGVTEDQLPLDQFDLAFHQLVSGYEYTPIQNGSGLSGTPVEPTSFRPAPPQSPRSNGAARESH